MPDAVDRASAGGPNGEPRRPGGGELVTRSGVITPQASRSRQAELDAGTHR
jgi:hypothetical protein